MEKPEYDADTQRALTLFVALLRGMDSVTAHARKDIAQHGLTPSEFAVLELLYHKGPLPHGEVAARVLLTIASISHVVDCLEKQELVERAPCPQDRRVSYVTLTEAGREKIAAIFPGHAECMRRAVSGLSPEEQEQATVLLKKMGLAAKELLARPKS